MELLIGSVYWYYVMKPKIRKYETWRKRIDAFSSSPDISVQIDVWSPLERAPGRLQDSRMETT